MFSNKIKNIKLELFYWRKCIFQYHKFSKYIYNKYILAPKILKHKGVLEKPITNSYLSIHILTCHKDFVMTLWSLASFYKVSENVGQLYIHNDGSLTENDKDNFKKFFPSCQIIEDRDVETKFNKFNSCPEIKKTRIEKNAKYFLIKKLLDPFLISNKNKILVIDSDLIWFKQPTDIENEINNNGLNSLMTTNNTKSYVYYKNNEKLSDNLALCNSGIVLYKKENFDLDKLEKYFKNFDYTNSKNNHFIEQAGYAYCLNNLEKLPAEKYTIDKNIDNNTCVKHYTSPKRPLFYIEGIEKIKNEILCVE